MTVCRAGAAACEVSSSIEHLDTCKQAHQQACDARISFNVINDGSDTNKRLACQEFMIVSTGAAWFGEAMITDIEVDHRLK